MFKPRDSHALQKRAWLIDRAAINKARKRLGLQMPVRVEVRDNDEWAGGYYPLHTVWVAADESMQDASYTIWHELTHALQCERDFGGDGAQFIAFMNNEYKGLVDDNDNILWDFKQEPYKDWLARYLALPVEAEAEEVAYRYADKHPLVKAR